VRRKQGTQRLRTVAGAWSPAATALLLVAVVGCGDDSGPSGPPPDAQPPEIAIVFPADGDYDRDGDGLVDVEIVFADSGGLDPVSVTVEASRPLGPASTGGTDLVAGFAVVEQSADRLVLEETTDALLPSGAIELVATVRDSAGNASEARRTVTLPAGGLHTILDLSPFGGGDPIGLLMLPDGSRGFVPTSQQLVAFDPWAVEMQPGIPGPALAGMVNGVYDPSTARVYISNNAFGFVHVFDPATDTFEPSIDVTTRQIGIERAPSGLLYVALSAGTASVGVIDPALREEVRVIDTGLPNVLNPQEAAHVFWTRIAPEQDRLYAALGIGVTPGGVVVIDLASSDITETINLSPGRDVGTSPHGISQDAVLDAARRRLYVTEASGLVEIDIDHDLVSRRIDSERVNKFLSVSPSGNRLFVSTTGSGAGLSAESWLVDVDTFTILERFTVSSPPTVQSENDSVFRTDGQLIFSLRPRAILSDGPLTGRSTVAVYLNREP